LEKAFDYDVKKCLMKDKLLVKKTAITSGKLKRDRRDWLIAGLYRFAEGGERNIQVEPIAQDLGVSKGSYYYYFESREQFIEEMLQVALEVTTQIFIDKSSAENSPLDRLKSLTVSVMSERRGKDFDFYIREFADKNRAASKFVQQMDGSRIQYLTKLFSGCGFTSLESADKAELYYNLYLGWYIRNRGKKITRTDIREQLRMLGSLFGLMLSD
jgi:AcrR family transcriptional regulator